MHGCRQSQSAWIGGEKLPKIVKNDGNSQKFAENFQEMFEIYLNLEYPQRLSVWCHSHHLVGTSIPYFKSSEHEVSNEV